MRFFLSLLLIFAMPSLGLSKTGTIKGNIYHQKTQTSVAGADVHLLETDEHYETKADGTFQFRGLLSGGYTISVSHPTYGTSKRRCEVKRSTTTEIKIYLDAAVELEKVIVEGERLPPTVSRQHIRGSELLRIPGTTNDALRGLTTLPGIGIPNDFFGILYIRGSEPGSNLYYLDRTPLGYPFHWGGLLSTISSETLDKIDIYAGGYGAEFGLDSQTVLDIHARDILEKRGRGKFNLNFLYSEGLLERSIRDNGYLSISGRRSYIDLIVGQFIEDGQFPYFSDYQLKFAYRLRKKHHLTFNAFAATDHFNIIEEQTQLEDEEAVSPEFGQALFKNGFTGQGVHLLSHVTDNLTSHLSLTRSVNYLTIDFKAIFQETVSELEDNGEIVVDFADSGTYDVKINVPIYMLREDLVYQLTPSFQFEPGFLLNFSPSKSFEYGRFLTSERIVSTENLPELSEDEEFVRDEDGTYIKRSFYELSDEFEYDFYRFEGYLQGRYNPFPFLSLALGIRLDYLNLTEKRSIQPRGSLSFRLPSSSILRFAYGHYEQNPRPYQVLSKNGNPGLEPSLARHYIMEFEHELSARTEFTFATYYKNMQKVITPEEISTLPEGDSSENRTYLNQGIAFVGGIEGFLKHRVPSKFFGWISYAYTHAELREHPGARYQPYLFDNTHILSLVANYNLTSTLEIGAKWQYLSGTSEVPFTSIFLIQDPVTRGLNPLLASVEEAVFAELTPYHKLDFRVSQKWNIMGMQIGGFIDILNLYNRENKVKFILKEGATLEIAGESTEVEEQETADVPQLPRILYFGITLEF